MSAAGGPAVPSSRWPFRHVGYALAVTAFGAGIPTPLYAIYETRFHFGTAVLAGIFAAYTIGVVATMILVAPLSDVLGRKPILYVGMGLTIASGLVFLFASGILALAIARIVSGLAVGATTSTATASMAGLEPRRDQHHVARVSVASNFGGVATGILLSGFLVAYVPDPAQVPFLILIGAAVLGLLLIAATPETVERAARKGRPEVQRISIPPTLVRPFWVAAGSLAACYSVYGYFAAIAPTFLSVELAISNRAISAIVIASMFGAAALIQLALGQVRDRRGLLIGLPIMLGATLLVTLAFPLRAFVLIGAGAVVLGLGVGFAYMGSVTLIDRLAPGPERGEILSAFFLTGYLALAVPTIGVGTTAQVVGLSVAGEAFGLALGLTLAVLFLLTRRTPTPAGGEGRPRSIT
jgi:MFS family permease